MPSTGRFAKRTFSAEAPQFRPTLQSLQSASNSNAAIVSNSNNNDSDDDCAPADDGSEAWSGDDDFLGDDTRPTLTAGQEYLQADTHGATATGTGTVAGMTRDLTGSRPLGPIDSSTIRPASGETMVMPFNRDTLAILVRQQMSVLVSL